MKKLSKFITYSLLCLALTVSMSLTTVKEAYANTQSYNLVFASYGDIQTITYAAPSKGYLTVTGVGTESYSSVSVKANGFKDWESLAPYSNNNTAYIGVKKGVYTIQFKSTSKEVNATVSFTKVKEKKGKTSKSKAAKLKRKKNAKGLFISNKKKAQWYKIKNTKNRKMTLVVDASKMSYGNSFSSCKLTVVFPNGKTDWTTVYPGSIKKIRVAYGPYGTNKARKGTYYVKIQSRKGATGYYTLKWK